MIMVILRLEAGPSSAGRTLLTSQNEEEPWGSRFVIPVFSHCVVSLSGEIWGLMVSLPASLNGSQVSGGQCCLFGVHPQCAALRDCLSWARGERGSAPYVL